MIKNIIFDFDGTIADSFAVFVDALRVVSKNKKNFSDVEIESLRKLSTREIIQALAIKKWQLPILLFKGKREISNNFQNVIPFTGIESVIFQLSTDHQLYILSTNSQQTIDTFLKKHQINQYFCKVVGDVGLLGKAKSIKKLCKSENLDVKESIYLGDETRDIEAAKKANITICSVGWGYADPNTLKKYKPDYFIDSPAQLLKVISN